MTTLESLQYELRGRFDVLGDVLKSHLSVRWESGPAIVRVGACIEPYTWDGRMQAIEALVDFERDHHDDFAVVFDVIPLQAVNDAEFAEA
jgi:hypothetical protein